MYKVRIRFDKIEEKKAIKIEGYTQNFPEVGVDFSIFLFKEDTKIFVDLGKTVNIKSYGDMMLVQTELTVAEVWIVENRVPEQAEVIPINPKTLMRIGGRIYGGRSGAAKKRDPRYLLDLWSSLSEHPANPPNLKLIYGDLQ